jgi:DNA modification methylase
MGCDINENYINLIKNRVHLWTLEEL